jgi:probable HAF family extracellular repeat protein
MGYARPSGDQVIHAFLWRSGTMIDLGTVARMPPAIKSSCYMRCSAGLAYASPKP